jgi:hypothetical protein
MNLGWLNDAIEEAHDEILNAGPSVLFDDAVAQATEKIRTRILLEHKKELQVQEEMQNKTLMSLRQELWTAVDRRITLPSP